MTTVTMDANIRHGGHRGRMVEGMAKWLLKASLTEMLKVTKGIKKQIRRDMVVNGVYHGTGR